MFREEKESKAHNPIDFDKRSEHNHECGPEILLTADEVITEQDEGCYGNIELLHLDTVQKFMSAKPVDQHLLPRGEHVMSDGAVEQEGERDEPQQHPQPHRRDGERAYHQ